MSSQNVSFTDQSPGYSYVVNKGMDSTRMIADGDDTDLQDFFSRPIKIAEYEWSTSVTFYQNIDPWSLFCEDSRVVNRLANYNLLKGNLCVKILINGNGFYYGRLLASYTPLANQDSLLKNRALITADLVSASQRPHLYIDPTLNQGGEMCLPFFYYYDAVSIPESGWNLLGELNIREMNALRHANGSTDPITVTVMAWMEDVVLSVPTSTNPSTIVAQSGMEKKKSTKKKKPRVSVSSNTKKDEYGTGPVSGPASTVARVAGMLTNAPFIGPYAKATQIAAGGIGSIAKLFGYSRAPTLEPIKEYTPRYYGDLAHCNTPDTSCKLTVDAKQELTVDGTVTGLDGTDEMTVKSIACRESFLDTAAWNLSDAVDQILFSCNVTPDLYRVYAPGGTDPNEWHFPACTFACTPFKYWRGSMKYRIQVVASAYHKGRLKIQWDPDGYTDQEFNTQFTHIVDISEDKDFTIDIGWGSRYGWLKNRPNSANDGYTIRAANTTMDSAFNNGTLTISVLNTLTSPSASAGTIVDVNVFLSAGDNFEVAVPTDEGIADLTPLRPWSEDPAAIAAAQQPVLEPQSGIEPVQTDKDDTAEPSAPVQKQVLVSMGNDPLDTDESLSVYHGESIDSFRSILKRYCYTGFLTLGRLGNTQNTEQTIKHLPPNPGYTTQPTWSVDSSNYVKNTPVAYLSSAFAACRGGMRWKAAYFNVSANDKAHIYMRVEPDTNAVIGYFAQLLDFTTVVVSPAIYGTFIKSTFAGSVWSPKELNPVVEGEIPYQTQGRFVNPRDISRTIKSNDKPFTVGAIHLAGSTGAGMLMHNAAAEDFSLHFYVGPPVFVDVQF